MGRSGYRRLVQGSQATHRAINCTPAKGDMTRMKALLMAMLLFGFTSTASAMSYSDWLQASDIFKRGYVFAYVEYVTTFASDEKNPRHG
jgi:hypothetical protein